MSNKFLSIGLLITLVIAIGAYSFPAATVTVLDKLGAVGTRFPNGLAVGTTADVTKNKLTIGNSGTAVGNYLFGSCAIIGAQVAQAATTTASYDCAVTGATSADIVLAQFASTTVSGGSGSAINWLITGAKGSTTAGFLTFTIANLGDGSRVLAATNIGSTTNYMLAR